MRYKEFAVSVVCRRVVRRVSVETSQLMNEMFVIVTVGGWYRIVALLGGSFLLEYSEKLL